MKEKKGKPEGPPLVGAHVSIAGGVWKAFARGAESGCSTIQIFTKNASRWRAPPLKEGDVLRFREEGKRWAMGPLVAHDSYLINLASPEPDLRERSRRAFLEEMERAERLGLDCFVAHPGAHTGSGPEAGIKRVTESLDWVHSRTPGFRVRVCLENTAGQGSVLAGDFNHLGEIFSRVGEPERLGVCFDTCHAFAAGYDLRKRDVYEKTMRSLEAAVGKGKVLVVHANDAKGELGSRLDRHEHLGRGRIGLECFRLVMNDPRLGGVPKILETPKERDGLPMDLVNLRLLRSLAGAKRLPPRLLERTENRVRSEG